MFPTAPPTTCNAKIKTIGRPKDFAVSNWKEPKSKFETVLDPAIKLPKAPMKGERSMNVSLLMLVSELAKTCGISEINNS